MPLILAVEPDRKQAEAVAALARGVLRSEVIVTDSADAALAVMAKRVPDLLLTSLLLPPKDEARIADRLRALDANGTYVQTLVIPMLASPGKRSQESKRNVNRLWKSKAKASAPDGCAPEVFASQISEYLRRAATEDPQRGRQLPNLEIEQTPVFGAAPAHVPEEPPRTNDVGRELMFRDPPQTDPPRTDQRADHPPTDRLPTEPIGAELRGTAPPGAKPLTRNEFRSSTPPRAESLIFQPPILQPPPQAPPIPSSPNQSSLIQPPPLQAPLLQPPLVQPPLAQVPPAQSAPRPEGPEAQAQKRWTAPKPAHHPEQKTAAGGPPPNGAGPADALAAEPPPQVAKPRPAPPFAAAGKPAQGAWVRPTPGSALRASYKTGPAPGPVEAKPSPNPAPPSSPAAPGPNAAPVVTPPSTRSASPVSERLRRLTTEQPPAPQVAPRAAAQPAAASVERAPSGDAGQSRDSAVRPMVVLGALDLGAFVEELTAAKEQPNLPEAQPAVAAPKDDQVAAASVGEPFFAATMPTAIQADPVQPLAVQPAAVQAGPGQAGAVQSGTAQPAAAPAATDSSRRDRGQKPRRAVQDEWGIFDPQQAGFAALFAKLEEITEQDDVPVEPPA